MKQATTTKRNRLRKLPMALGAALVLTLAGAATAEWKVGDENSLGELKKANTKLGEMYTQQSLGKSAKSGEAVTDPEQKIEKGTITLTTGVERCKNASNEQKANCEEIAKTENSQYLYMVKMFEITTERKKRLEELETQRSGMSATRDYGKMQDNTNQLTALYTRMSLDRAQMESANFAYETRLRYLKQMQTQKTENRMSGKNDDESGSPFGNPADLLSGVAAGATLKFALDAQKSSEPEGFKKYDWL